MLTTKKYLLSLLFTLVPLSVLSVEIQTSGMLDKEGSKYLNALAGKIEANETNLETVEAPTLGAKYFGMDVARLDKLPSLKKAQEDLTHKLNALKTTLENAATINDFFKSPKFKSAFAKKQTNPFFEFFKDKVVVAAEEVKEEDTKAAKEELEAKSANVAKLQQQAEALKAELAATNKKLEAGLAKAKLEKENAKEEARTLVEANAKLEKENAQMTSYNKGLAFLLSITDENKISEEEFKNLSDDQQESLQQFADLVKDKLEAKNAIPTGKKAPTPAPAPTAEPAKEDAPVPAPYPAYDDALASAKRIATNNKTDFEKSFHEAATAVNKIEVKLTKKQAQDLAEGLNNNIAKAQKNSAYNKIKWSNVGPKKKANDNLSRFKNKFTEAGLDLAADYGSIDGLKSDK